MAFWNRVKTEPSAEAASSQRNLEQGGLPLLAMRRIKAEMDRPDRRFTSDLSVNELALTHAVGYLPVSQVLGSSVYHVGWQYMSSSSWMMSGELDVLTKATSHARLLALTRMQTEAKMLGADGVVGVRIEQQRYDWAGDLIEFVAVGTAIKLPGAPPAEQPFLSDLSAQEFWALHQAGYRPAGIVFGNCVWYQVASWATQFANNQGGWAINSFFNQELTDFTQAVFNARSIAMYRMEQECRQFGGDGVVGAKINTDVSEYEVETGNDNKRTDLIVTFEALGTAITTIDRDKVPVIDYVVSLG